MDKLTLQEVSAYLPHEVKFISEMDKPYDEYGKQPIWTLNGIHELFGDYSLLTKENKDSYAISKCKLLLRPLSQLTQEIEHKGERFVPKNRLRKLSGAFEPDEEFKNPFSIHIVDGIVIGFSAICVHVNQIELFQKLHEWHFDTANLLGRGLAVEIKEGV